MLNKIQNKIFLSNRELPGMTLIELIISMSIIVFITAIFVTNYNSTNKRTDLIMASQSIVSDIHQAQNNSLGLKKYGDVVPAGGWGINFDLQKRTQYVVFADLQAPNTTGYMVYDTDESDTNLGGRVVSLPPQTELLALRVLANGGTLYPVYNANVTFLPPDPRTNIYYNNTTTSSAIEIDIKELKNNSIKTIKVNFLGLAEVAE